MTLHREEGVLLAKWQFGNSVMADEEHRSSVRQRTLKGAKVVLRDRSTFDCVIRNQSDTGARLQFSDPVALPEQFDILITSSNTLVPAQRMWERGTAVGVRFTGPERRAPPRKF
jgi:hypothetical protein